jgi:RNA polymerase sigma factor (sigma-70 family)
MPTDESVTEWITGLKDREDSAAQHLYERYMERLVVLAREKLRGLPHHMADEEDVALAAFNSFFLGARQGRFPQLHDRNDLWQILVMLAERKAIDQIRRERSKKRIRELGESALGIGDPYGCGPVGVEGAMGCDPSPDFVAEMTEEVSRRMAQLETEQLKKIAMLKLEGHSNKEIAQLLGCVPRTVERRLELIRRIWRDG